jgi:hypothetical protein
MSIHDLVRDGAVVASRDFADGTVPELAPNKGQWLPRVVIDPDYDPVHQVKTGPVETIEATRTLHTYTVSARPLADRKAEMLRQLADKRWRVETGGITLGGVTIPTDRDTQSIVARAVAAFADGDISGAIDFKAATGFVQIDEALMKAIKAAGAQHVQVCFTHEAEVSAAIGAAADHTALDAIDIDAGW